MITNIIIAFVIVVLPCFFFFVTNGFATDIAFNVLIILIESSQCYHIDSIEMVHSSIRLLEKQTEKSFSLCEFIFMSRQEMTIRETFLSMELECTSTKYQLEKYFHKTFDQCRNSLFQSIISLSRNSMQCDMSFCVWQVLLCCFYIGMRQNINCM